VLNHDDGCALVYEVVEHVAEPSDVTRVCANTGLIQHKEGVFSTAPAYLFRELESLGLATRKRGCGSAQGEIAQSNILHGFEGRLYLAESGKVSACF